MQQFERLALEFLAHKRLHISWKPFKVFAKLPMHNCLKNKDIIDMGSLQ